MDINIVGTTHRIFEGCSSLSSLPDISNWNTKNVTDINLNSMFNECYNLIISERTKKN